jgi:hypothetical protein
MRGRPQSATEGSKASKGPEIVALPFATFATQTLKVSAGCVHFAYVSVPFTTDFTDGTSG